MTFERGTGAGFAPVFKVVGWKGEPPRCVTIDGKEVPAASAALNGTLILQVLGRIEGERAALQIGK